jgi:hypothetical protein
LERRCRACERATLEHRAAHDYQGDAEINNQPGHIDQRCDEMGRKMSLKRLLVRDSTMFAP